MSKWVDYQNDIDKAKKQLRKHLKLPLNCKEKDLFVDLPVFWDTEGRSQIANPVNGLFLNGTYLYSQQEKKLIVDYKFDEKRVSYKSTVRTSTFSALKNAVEYILKHRLPAKLVDVSTTQYDNAVFGGGGNMHCATLNIVLPCKPK